MDRLMLIREYNPQTNQFDTLYPQGRTDNIIDLHTGYTLHESMVNYENHIRDYAKHTVKAIAGGNGKVLVIDSEVITSLFDGLTVAIKLNTYLECEPTLSVNGGPYHNIVLGNGDRAPGGHTAGAFIFIMWSEANSNWVLLNDVHYTDMMKVMLPMMSDYWYESPDESVRNITIPGFDYKNDTLTVNYEQTILRYGIDYDYDTRTTNSIILLTFGIPAGDKLLFNIVKYTLTSRTTASAYKLFDTIADYEYHDGLIIVVPSDRANYYKTTINYGQTILREGVDYTIETNAISGISTVRFEKDMVATGDMLHVTTAMFEEVPEAVSPNNWGSTGNYRYQVQIERSLFTSNVDECSLVAIPNFDKNADSVAVVLNNLSLIEGVDYELVSNNELKLFTRTLDRGQSIYFTITKGIMADVPPVIQAKVSNADPKNLFIDMMENMVCDGLEVIVEITNTVADEPTLKCMDGSARLICDAQGKPLCIRYVSGSFMKVRYSAKNDCWMTTEVNPYRPSKTEYATGVASFIDVSGTIFEKEGRIVEAVVPHNLGYEPVDYRVVPIEPPTIGTTIGDVWVHVDDMNLYVGNSGTSKSAFKWYAK